MNGVIVQSNHLKHTAMLDLFAKWPQHRGLIEAYNRGSGGIPRMTKFRHIWEQILRLPYDDAVELALSTRYAFALAASLPQTPLVEGVDRLLTDAGVPIYVSSAAPQEELRQQLEHRRLARHVANAFGYPIGKADALRQVVVQSGADLRDIVFFGDSSADRDAAIEVGVSFIAVTREKNEFVDVDCLKITDFQDRNALCNAVLCARYRKADSTAAITDPQIAAAILASLSHRNADASSCPSEVARALAPMKGDLWRELMPRIRDMVATLAREDRVIITRGAEVLSPDNLYGGPIRIRRGKCFPKKKSRG